MFVFAATIDVKKSIYDLACNTRDTQIALVENQGMFDSVQESIVKIYDIGRSRTTEDEPVSTFCIFCEYNLKNNSCKQ